MKTYVTVTGHSIGYHCWPEAPVEVAFLASRHRHVFHWRIKVRADHDNRAVEFFLLKSDVLKLIATTFKLEPTAAAPGIEFGSMSCEMIAKAIGAHLLIGGYDVVEVTVGEDNENEATVDYEVPPGFP